MGAFCKSNMSEEERLPDEVIRGFERLPPNIDSYYQLLCKKCQEAPTEIDRHVNSECAKCGKGFHTSIWKTYGNAYFKHAPQLCPGCVLSKNKCMACAKDKPNKKKKFPFEASCSQCFPGCTEREFFRPRVKGARS